MATMKIGWIGDGRTDVPLAAVGLVLGAGAGASIGVAFAGSVALAPAVLACAAVGLVAGAAVEAWQIENQRRRSS